MTIRASTAVRELPRIRNSTRKSASHRVDKAPLSGLCRVRRGRQSFTIQTMRLHGVQVVMGETLPSARPTLRTRISHRVALWAGVTHLTMDPVALDSRKMCDDPLFFLFMYFLLSFPDHLVTKSTPSIGVHRDTGPYHIFRIPISIVYPGVPSIWTPSNPKVPGFSPQSLLYYHHHSVFGPPATIAWTTNQPSISLVYTP